MFVMKGNEILMIIDKLEQSSVSYFEVSKCYNLFLHIHIHLDNTCAKMFLTKGFKSENKLYHERKCYILREIKQESTI